jgi:hypothetical protein
VQGGESSVSLSFFLLIKTEFKTLLFLFGGCVTGEDNRSESRRIRAGMCGGEGRTDEVRVDGDNC